MENGQMYQVQNQQKFQVRERISNQNGLVVNPDGSYQYRNQAQVRLGEGECLDPEGMQYRSQSQYQQQMQNRYMAMAEPHFAYQNGQVIQTQNQMQTQLRSSWKLNNGTIVNPDGTYQNKNGKREQLRNGEYLDWDGQRYENQERFRERMQQRLQDKNEMKQRERIERKTVNEPRKRIG